MKGRIIRNEMINRLSLPIIGKIKIGIKDDRGLPKSIDYFVSTGKYAGLFTKAYGEKPQTIQIVFSDDNAEKVCRERYEYRNDQGDLIASGDGETFEVWDGKKYQTLTTEQYPNLMHSIEARYPNKLYQRTGEGWQIVLTLNFIIPCVRGVAGVWQFSTKGTASTIPQIRDVFDEMKERRGFVKNIIFDMNVKFAKSQKPGDNSRYPVVSIVPNESEENVNKIKQAYKSLGFNQPKLEELKE